MDGKAIVDECHACRGGGGEGDGHVLLESYPVRRAIGRQAWRSGYVAGEVPSTH